MLIRFIVLFFIFGLSGCAGMLAQHGTAENNGLIPPAPGKVVKSSKFFIGSGNASIYCGSNDVYLVRAAYTREGVFFYKAYALRREFSEYFFASSKTPGDTETPFAEMRQVVGGYKLSDITSAKGVNGGCGFSDYYVTFSAKWLDRSSDVVFDFVDRSADYVQMRADYKPERLQSRQDFEIVANKFRGSEFSNKVFGDMFNRFYSVKVRNKDSKFITNAQSGLISTARGGCKDIVRDVEFSLKQKNATVNDINIDADFKIDLNYDPKTSKEGTTISYKDPVVSKRISLTKSNGYKNTVTVSYPCVTFSTRYVYVYVTDFLLKSYIFSIDIKKVD